MVTVGETEELAFPLYPTTPEPRRTLPRQLAPTFLRTTVTIPAVRATVWVCEGVSCGCAEAVRKK